MKVLVVEDEPKIAGYIKKGLQLKSYVVDLAVDGEEGLSLATSEKYDVIVLDWMLPNVSGMEVCRRLRAEGNQTPILMLTAKAQVDDRVEGLEAGADDYLGKPFAFAELLARIKALGRRPQQTTGTVLRCDTLELDTNSYQVKRAGKVIDVSRKEFALLEFLLRHQGKVLTKDQLTLQVWSYDSDVLPNTAQVYLGYLRNKIDRAFELEAPLIHTIRGFGYKFGKIV